MMMTTTTHTALLLIRIHRMNLVVPVIHLRPSNRWSCLRRCQLQLTSRNQSHLVPNQVRPKTIPCSPFPKATNPTMMRMKIEEANENHDPAIPKASVPLERTTSHLDTRIPKVPAPLGANPDQSILVEVETMMTRKRSFAKVHRDEASQLLLQSVVVPRSIQIADGVEAMTRMIH